MGDTTLAPQRVRRASAGRAVKARTGIPHSEVRSKTTAMHARADGNARKKKTPSATLRDTRRVLEELKQEMAELTEGNRSNCVMSTWRRCDCGQACANVVGPH